MGFFCFITSFPDQARNKGPLIHASVHTAWLSAHKSWLSVHTLRAIEGTLSRRCLIPQGTAKSRTEIICTFSVWDLMDRLLGLNVEWGCRYEEAESPSFGPWFCVPSSLGLLFLEDQGEQMHEG